MLILAVVLIVLLLVVCTALLGTMREVALLEGKVTSFTDLLLRPPTPAFIDGILPEPARAELISSGIGDMSTDMFLIFVRQGCSGCNRLMQGLKDSISAGVLLGSQVVCVLGPQSRGTDLEATIQTVGMTLIIDYDRALAQACQVKQMPMTLHLAERSLQVQGVSVGDDIRWLLSRASRVPKEVQN